MEDNTMNSRHTKRNPGAPSAWAIGVMSLVAVVVFETPIHAYIDPGATGMLVQVIIGALAALGYGLRRTIKLTWLRLWTLFGGKSE